MNLKKISGIIRDKWKVSIFSRELHFGRGDPQLHDLVLSIADDDDDDNLK